MAEQSPADVVSFADATGRGPEVLGGKGAGLASMHHRGLNVPPGFILTTDAYSRFRRDGELSADLRAQIRGQLKVLERVRGRKLGDLHAPLLLAVRSGAPVSMPGMMDTVLNLGIDDHTVLTLARECGRDFAFDCYARFLAGFATVVLGIDADRFDDVAAPEARVEAYRAVIADEYGSLPEDLHVQLDLAIEAVFRSWDNARAVTYRRIEGIDDSLGTAVVIQSMVFGNLNSDSGTGVVFTRNPNTGERVAYGDFLFDAQGEDVVSGTRQTLPVNVLERRLPLVWRDLSAKMDMLEEWRRDMLDIEFTVEDGRLFFLQVRTAKRTPAAAVRVAKALADEGVITRGEAIMRVKPSQIDGLTRTSGRPRAGNGLTRGLAACPGVATGAICLSTDAVLDAVDRGTPAILVRRETSPDDVHGMALANGILTGRGGLVSHAAVVAREMGVPAVVGADGITIDVAKRSVNFGSVILREGDVITIDGDTGLVDRGAVEVEVERDHAVDEILTWADEIVATAGAIPRTDEGGRLEAAQRIIAGADAAGVRVAEGAQP